MVNRTESDLELYLKRLYAVSEVVEMWSPFGWLTSLDWIDLLDEPVWEATQKVDAIVSAQDAINLLAEIFSILLEGDEFLEREFDLQDRESAGYKLFDLLQERDLLGESGLERA